MRLLALLLTTIPTASPALAQSGPSTRDMTCDQAQRLVAAQGGIVLHTGPRTYDHFVSGGHFCIFGSVPQSERVSTRDTPHCPLLVCRPYEEDKP